MKFSSLAALEVVEKTTSSAVSEDNFVKMTTNLVLSYQWPSLLRGHQGPIGMRHTPRCGRQ